MSANTNGTSDGTDIIWITLAGMFFLGLSLIHISEPTRPY